MRTKSPPNFNSRLTEKTAVFRTTYNGLPERKLGLILILITLAILLLLTVAAVLIIKFKEGSPSTPEARIQYTGQPRA